MEHYQDAALRHFADASQLLSSGKLDNAGHLIGFAAECAIKHGLSIQSGQVGPHGHLPDLQQIAMRRLTHRSSLHQVLKQPVLAGWLIERRYYATGTTSLAEVNAWFAETQRIFAASKLRARQ